MAMFPTRRKAKHRAPSLWARFRTGWRRRSQARGQARLNSYLERPAPPEKTNG